MPSQKKADFRVMKGVGFGGSLEAMHIKLSEVLQEVGHKNK